MRAVTVTWPRLTERRRASRTSGSQRERDDGSLIDGLKKRQSDLQVRLDAHQAMLKAQFSALEVALSKVQTQSSWLAGQLARL